MLPDNKVKRGDACFVVFKDEAWSPHPDDYLSKPPFDTIVYGKYYAATIWIVKSCCIEVLLDKNSPIRTAVKHESVFVKPLSIKHLVQSLVTRE